MEGEEVVSWDLDSVWITISIFSSNEYEYYFKHKDTDYIPRHHGYAVRQKAACEADLVHIDSVNLRGNSAGWQLAVPPP